MLSPIVKRYFVIAAWVSLAAGVALLALSLLPSNSSLSLPLPLKPVLFGLAMLFAGVANSLAFIVLGRMTAAGSSVGVVRWPGADFRLYSAYWKIAPARGWSGAPLLGHSLHSFWRPFC
jgi:hypothetical protein